MSMGGSRAQAKPIKKASLKRVVRLFAPYKPQVAWIVVLVLASAGLGLLSPFFLRVIVDTGLTHHDLGVVTSYSIYTLLATFGGIGFGLGFAYLSIIVGQRIMQDLRNDLYSHLQGMSLKFFTGTRTGEIQSRLANDIGGVQSVVSDTAANLLSNVTTVISTLVAMIIMDWRLTILSVGVLPVFAFLASKVGDKMRTLRQKIQSQLADLNATMGETLSVSGVLLTKTSGRQALSLKKFKGENEAMTQSSVKMAMIMRIFFNMIGLTFSVTPVLVYWLAGWLVIGRHDAYLTIGLIVAFTSLQARLFFPLTSLLNVQVEVMSAMALFDRIFEYMDMKQDIVDAPDAIAIDPHELRGQVSFKDVTFRYEASQENPTLDGINLDAAPGQLVALVGKSGSGKTTMTYLIPRLYDVDSGVVEIDGIDVRNVKLDSLGQSIAVVTQETYLVHDTIRENLRYGKPDATDDELEAAAKAAAIHDHISSLPDKYDTIVGERGYKLSGGEKQRVAIARAILKNPRILILDEATSALDTHSERLIQSALVTLMKGRTTFAVAHRLSTIQAADQIIVLIDGKVVERGTHAQLLDLEGEYSRLYHIQFEDQSEGVMRSA